MRISNIVFAVIGLFGFLFPEKLLTHPKPYNRLVFLILSLIALADAWRLQKYNSAPVLKSEAFSKDQNKTINTTPQDEAGIQDDSSTDKHRRF